MSRQCRGRPWRPVCKFVLCVRVVSETKIKHACVDHLLNCGYRTLTAYTQRRILCWQLWAPLPKSQVPSSKILKYFAFLLHGPPPCLASPAARPVPHTAPHPPSFGSRCVRIFCPIFLSFLLDLSFFPFSTSSSTHYTPLFYHFITQSPPPVVLPTGLLYEKRRDAHLTL